MKRAEFDDAFSFFSLSELIQKLPSKRKVKELLQTFPCSKNTDLQEFLHNKALTFEQHLRARTYVYIDNESKEVSAYFTIAISTLYTDGISKEIIKLLDGYQDNTKSIPCYLIGQLGKSDHYDGKKIGEFILEDAIEILDALNQAIGGRFILLDAINVPQVIKFYQDNSFFAIEESEGSESIKMIRPYFEENETT